jgi:hypothetical protein
MSSRVHEAGLRKTTLARFVSVAGATALLAFVAASPAGAATIHTCVSKKSGAMRIVSARAKCRGGERKLSWNSSGAAGPAGPGGASGAPGAAGKQGADGVGVDFTSSKTNTEPVSLKLEVETVIVSKTLPAGSYFVTASSAILAQEAGKAVVSAVSCGISDSAATPSIKEPKETLDESIWLAELASTGTEYQGGGSTALQAQLTTTAPTTLALICVSFFSNPTTSVEMIDPQLSALQTTADE